MPTTIQIKRSQTTAEPESLAEGELAHSGNGEVLYIGSNSVVVPIAGLRTPGTLTANQALVTNATGYIDEIRTANLVVSGAAINAINAVANSSTLGAVANTELATTWAIKTYVDEKVSETAGSADPGGSNTHIQYNDSGVMGGSAALTFNETTNTVSLANTLLVGSNLIVNTSAVWIGNSTVNSVMNSSVLQIQQINGFYSISLAQGIVFGNTTANVTVNSETLDLRTTSGALRIGNSTINTVINSTSAILGNATSNVVIGTESLKIGNTSVNATFNTTSLVIGATVLNTTTLSVRDAVISGNLAINGTLTTIDTENVIVEDSLIKLARNNEEADSVDIGFYGMYESSGDRFTGLVRDASDGKYKLFANSTVEPTTTIDTEGTGHTTAILVAQIESTSANITGGSISGITDLAVADGGTGVGTFTAGGLLYGNTTGPLGVTAAGSEGQVMLANSSGLPAWFSAIDGGSF